MSLLPTHMRPRHRYSIADWYPAVHISVFSSGVPFSGTPLPALMRPKHRYSVDGWYPAVHMSGFSSDVTFLVLHYPRPLRPKHRDAVTGWYPAVRVFLFPSSGATFSGAPSFVLCVPLHQYFLPSGLVTLGPRINPYQRHLSLNHQSSIINHQSLIINHEVWVGL